jgi:hypothetical protein
VSYAVNDESREYQEHLVIPDDDNEFVVAIAVGTPGRGRDGRPYEASLRLYGSTAGLTRGDVAALITGLQHALARIDEVSDEG